MKEDNNSAQTDVFGSFLPSNKGQSNPVKKSNDYWFHITV